MTTWASPEAIPYPGRRLGYIEKTAIGFPTGIEGIMDLWRNIMGGRAISGQPTQTGTDFAWRTDKNRIPPNTTGSTGDATNFFQKFVTGNAANATKGKNVNLQNLVNEIYGDISDYQNPYLAQLEPLVSQWLSPDYKAYSDQQLKDWYEQGKQQLEGDIFKEWDEGYGQSMAARNLTGSGVGNIAYGKILGQKGGALADLWGNLQKYGEEATRSDRTLATSLVPTMTQLANLPMEQKMQLLNLLTSQYAAEQQRKGQSAQGWGSAIGSILGALIPKI